MNTPSSFFNDFKAELVANAAWASDPETTKNELITEIINLCSSSRNERIKVYDSFITEGKITAFEMMMMEIDYCTYIEFVREQLNHLYFLESYAEKVKMITA
jgi:hypothetical protein